jgi:hypothetical protein
MQLSLDTPRLLETMSKHESGSLSSGLVIAPLNERDTVHHVVLPSTKKILFPCKLRRLLDDAARDGNESIVSWLPHGRAFQVHKPLEFTENLMRRYFRQTLFRSFTRQVSQLSPLARLGRMNRKGISL